MLITSATTVPTVTHLTISELEKYKKQFQSFWLPFMEQFIPATTIWVAGERWCNDPCPVINICDLDFELVESETSITQISTLRQRISSQRGYTSNTLDTNQATSGSLGRPSVSNGTSDRKQLIKVTDLGLTNTTPVIRNVTEINIDMSSYKNRFTELTTETITL